VATIDAIGNHPRRHPAEILDEGQPQHDGNGPQLTQHQRGHRLVGRDDTVEGLRIDPRVTMRNRFKRDVVNSGQIRGGSAQQPGEFPAVALGEVPPRGPDLLFDEIEVVEQPLTGGLDSLPGLDRRTQQLEGLRQDRLILAQPSQKQIGPVSWTGLMRGREGTPVALHLIAAEQRRSDRRLGARWGGKQ
jgi:hypothetical protein